MSQRLDVVGDKIKTVRAEIREDVRERRDRNRSQSNG